MNIYEIYIVTGVLCGAVAAWIAKQKGQSPILWFFIGAVLNVAFLSILVFRASRGSEAAVPKGK